MNNDWNYDTYSEFDYISDTFDSWIQNGKKLSDLTKSDVKYILIYDQLFNVFKDVIIDKITSVGLYYDLDWDNSEWKEFIYNVINNLPSDYITDFIESQADDKKEIARIFIKQLRNIFD